SARRCLISQYRQSSQLQSLFEQLSLDSNDEPDALTLHDVGATLQIRHLIVARRGIVVRIDVEIDSHVS
ncbi:MAG TPA: hypothetical protein VF505_11605, partial [Thermoanaerobaculia bacterium]